MAKTVYDLFSEEKAPGGGQTDGCGISHADAAGPSALKETCSSKLSKSIKSKKIVKVSEDIAFQTNILARNAAVETARAGAAGKGFAVAADEVWNLAGKSVDSANQIAKLIQDTMDAMKGGITVANQTAKSLDEATSGMTDVMNEITRIADSYQKAAAELSGIATGIDQVAAVVQTNSATAEELNGQVELMKQLVDTFQLDSQEMEQDDSVGSTFERPAATNAGPASNFEKYQLV